MSAHSLSHALCRSSLLSASFFFFLSHASPLPPAHDDSLHVSRTARMHVAVLYGSGRASRGAVAARGPAHAWQLSIQHATLMHPLPYFFKFFIKHDRAQCSFSSLLFFFLC